MLGSWKTSIGVRSVLVWIAVLSGMVSVSSSQWAASFAGEPIKTQPRPLVAAQAGGPPTLQPFKDQDGPTLNVHQQMYEALTKTQDYSIKLVPALATSWKPLNDRTWQFKLRENLKFHNGEPFDAEAVKFSFEWILNPANKAQARARASTVTGVEVVDAYTVNVISKTPDGTLPLALKFWLIVPPKYTREKGFDYLARYPVGTGPFKFVEWKQGDHITMEANPDYWRGRPNFDRLVIKQIDEASTRVAALMAGEVDIAAQIPPDLVGVVKGSPKTRVESASVAISMILQIDTVHGPADHPLKKKKVRQALNYAVDKVSLLKNLLGGYGSVLDGQGVTREAFGANPNLKSYSYDPAKAKQLLAEAGYPNGFSFTINSPVGKYLMDKEMMIAVADQLGKVGVKAKVQILEWGVFSDIIRAKANGESFLIGWYDHGDAELSLMHAMSGSPYAFWANKEFDALMAQGRSTLDQQKREQLYWKATALMHDDPPGIFLLSLPALYGVSSRVENYKPEPSERFNFFPARLKP